MEVIDSKNSIKTEGNDFKDTQVLYDKQDEIINSIVEVEENLTTPTTEPSSSTIEDDYGPTIHFHKSETTPLIIQTEIVNSPTRKFSCLVDNGAEINLVRADVIGELNNITLENSYQSH